MDYKSPNPNRKYTNMTIYRQTGERFRTELKKRGLRSANAVSHIIEHFLLMEDEAKDRIFRGEYQ